MTLPDLKSTPPKRPRSLGSVVGRLILIVFVLALLAGVAAVGAWIVATTDGPLKEPRVVNVPGSASAGEVADMLEREGVVESGTFASLAISAMKAGFGVKLKDGEHKFAANSSLVDVLRTLKRGRLVRYKITFPEGFTTWQVLERLKANDVLQGEIASAPGEGELLPDTYVFTRGRTRQSIIDQMKRAQASLMEDLWTKRAAGLPVSTHQEALTLASIVEKETGKADERGLVAGVFINRLKKGMRLQSDPTIIYGITQGQGKLDRPIYRSDIRKKTDYNTYQIDGLPPSPIANPGRAAIEAVLNPVETDFIFFVADGTGGHAFAATLKEHNANVRKWRKWVRQQRKLREDEAAAQEELRSSIAGPDADGDGSDVQTQDKPSAGEQSAPAPTTDENAANDQPAATPKVQVNGREVPIPRAKPTAN